MVKRPFTKISAYYDTLMKGIEYKEWVDYTVGLFKYYGHKPEKILDLACGTGSATVELARRGYQVVGLDKSAHMLEIFKEKRGAEKVEVMISDMTDFKLAEPVDAVTCYFDSVNYLTEERLVRKCFKSVHHALADKGLFVFDMNTIYGLEKVWGTNVLIREMDNIYSVWKSVYDASRHLSTLYLTLFVRNGTTYERVDEVHQERAYPLGKVREFLTGAGFDHVDIFAHLTTSNFIDISSRVMVIAEKGQVEKKLADKITEEART